jgi:hypothetical protein
MKILTGRKGSVLLPETHDNLFILRPGCSNQTTDTKTILSNGLIASHPVLAKHLTIENTPKRQLNQIRKE